MCSLSLKHHFRNKFIYQYLWIPDNGKLHVCNVNILIELKGGACTNENEIDWFFLLTFLSTKGAYLCLVQDILNDSNYTQD